MQSADFQSSNLFYILQYTSTIYQRESVQYLSRIMYYIVWKSWKEYGIPQSSQSNYHNLTTKKLKLPLTNFSEVITKQITVMYEKKLPLSRMLITEKRLEFVAILGQYIFQA